MRRIGAPIAADQRRKRVNQNSGRIQVATVDNLAGPLAPTRSLQVRLIYA